MNITVIIPLYNESDTILSLLEKLLALSIDCEIILIDDGSTDTSRHIIQSLNHPDIRLLYHSSRAGKGAAVQTGLQAASGDIVVIQDADLEYEPSDIIPLVKLVTSGQTDVAYGVRDLSAQKPIIRLGNRFLTGLTNMLYGQSLRDMTTCYKVMRGELMQALQLECNGFAIEAEITAKLFRLGHRITALPISYTPRYINKKLKLWHGFSLLWALLKYRFWRPSAQDASVREEMVELDD